MDTGCLSLNVSEIIHPPPSDSRLGRGRSPMFAQTFRLWTRCHGCHHAHQKRPAPIQAGGHPRHAMHLDHDFKIKGEQDFQDIQDVLRADFGGCDGGGEAAESAEGYPEHHLPRFFRGGHTVGFWGLSKPTTFCSIQEQRTCFAWQVCDVADGAAWRCGWSAEKVQRSLSNKKRPRLGPLFALFAQPASDPRTQSPISQYLKS